MRFCIRKFGADSRAMSKSAEDALQSIKEAREKAHKLKLNAMSKKERRKFPVGMHPHANGRFDVCFFRAIS